MNGNAELLNYIYQNSEMGQDTLSKLIDMTDNVEFKKLLQSQLNQYSSIYNEAEVRLKETHNEAKPLGTLVKVSTYISLNLNTLTDKTPSHMSEMIIQGSTMGIIDITKKIKDYQEKDPSILALANRLLNFEENTVESFKKYL